MNKNTERKKWRQRFLQKYRQWSHIAVILYFLFGYLSLGTLFACIYHFGDGIQGVHGFWDVFFFSIITQATVGYGNMFPTGNAQAWVVLHSLLGTVYTAVGGGLVFVKMLLPPRRSLIFDTELLYDPHSKQFNLRIKNDLGVTLYLVQVEVRAEYEGRERHLHHIDVALATPTVHRIRSGTIYRPEFEGPLPSTGSKNGGAILTPGWFKEHPESIIEVVAFANYFAGDASQEKDFRPVSSTKTFDGAEHRMVGNILCGTYKRDWIDHSFAVDPEIKATGFDPKLCGKCLGRQCPLRLSGGGKGSSGNTILATETLKSPRGYNPRGFGESTFSKKTRWWARPWASLIRKESSL